MYHLNASEIYMLNIFCDQYPGLADTACTMTKLVVSAKEMTTLEPLRFSRVICRGHFFILLNLAYIKKVSAKEQV